MNRFTAKMETFVPGKRAGQKAGLAENLETIADADDHLAPFCGRLH